MYLVFGRIFNLNEISPHYGLALLIGIVLWSLFADGTNQGMISTVHRESLLRRLSFPRVIIPTAATLTAAMTFAINLVVVAGFVAWEGIVPQPDWLLILPLLLELYLFTLGMALILTTLFVSLARHGPGLGARSSAAVLRVSDRLPDHPSASWARDFAFSFRSRR